MQKIISVLKDASLPSMQNKSYFGLVFISALILGWNVTWPWHVSTYTLKSTQILLLHFDLSCLPIENWLTNRFWWRRSLRSGCCWWYCRLCHGQRQAYRGSWSRGHASWTQRPSGLWERYEACLNSQLSWPLSHWHREL